MIWPSSFKSSCMEGMKTEHYLLDFAQFPRKPEQTMSMTEDLAIYHRARYACLITYLSTRMAGKDQTCIKNSESSPQFPVKLNHEHDLMERSIPVSCHVLVKPRIPVAAVTHKHTSNLPWESKNWKHTRNPLITNIKQHQQISPTHTHTHTRRRVRRWFLSSIPRLHHKLPHNTVYHISTLKPPVTSTELNCHLSIVLELSSHYFWFLTKDLREIPLEGPERRW